MHELRLLAAIALTAGLMASASARILDESKFPDLKGQWDRVGVPNSTPAGTPPLTPEYQAVYEANRADMKNGGAGGVPSEDEFVPTHAGYSIGKWIDEDGDGKFDVLEVETRHLLNPRVYDASGLPFHTDGKTVVKERIYLDKADNDILYDEITVFDNALTRPWSITKKAKRSAKAHPLWRTAVCAEENARVKIENENYFLSADGKLMPTRKDQPPPDLQYFPRKER